MTLAPHTIQGSYGAKKSKKRLGRGNASQKGTSSGRGGKGQTARSGGGSRTTIRAFKRVSASVPKLRGFKSLKAKAATVSLQTLDRKAKDGDTVSPAFLHNKGVIASPTAEVKIVASGKLTKKISLQGCMVSKSAAEIIEKLGGKIVY